jgi:hypothetical protein
MTPHVAAQVTEEVATFCREPQPAKAITVSLGLKPWENCQANYFAPFMAMHILERTIPDEPRRWMQRYRKREAGLAASKQLERGS